jgi:hypothetical protein
MDASPTFKTSAAEAASADHDGFSSLYQPPPKRLLMLQRAATVSLRCRRSSPEESSGGVFHLASSAAEAASDCPCGLDASPPLPQATGSVQRATHLASDGRRNGHPRSVESTRASVTHRNGQLLPEQASHIHTDLRRNGCR